MSSDDVQAAVAAARTRAAGHSLFMACLLPGGDDEVPTAVQLPGRLVVADRERAFFAVGNGPDSFRRDSEEDQVVADRVGAPLAECEVVLSGVPLVAVPRFGARPGRASSSLSTKSTV